MPVPITMPELGVPMAAVSLWFVGVGDTVFEGERVVEVLAAGATFDVSAPATGKLVERLAWPRDLLQPGQVLGVLETAACG